jgi:hypothetical protein
VLFRDAADRRAVDCCSGTVRGEDEALRRRRGPVASDRDMPRRGRVRVINVDRPREATKMRVPEERLLQ